MPVSKKKKYNDKPFGYHQEIELTISTLTNLGQGLGRVALEGAEGDRKWVVMVPFALPGERVRARVFRNHANFSEADLIEVIESSPHRVEPRCPLFGRCGGCQYQNLSYGEQLDWKRRQVAELLLLGMPYRDIGAQLFISAKTVEHHVARIRRRLGAESRSEMLSMLRAIMAPEVPAGSPS